MDLNIRYHTVAGLDQMISRRIVVRGCLSSTTPVMARTLPLVPPLYPIKYSETRGVPGWHRPEGKQRHIFQTLVLLPMIG
jgi:hypothetical protein